MPAKNNQTGFLQALDDMVRIAANGLTFGGADRVAEALGERDTAAKTAAARERAGIVGDATDILGMGGGLKLGYNVLKKAPAVGRAIFSKKGLAAGGIGLGTLLNYNSRTGAGEVRAAPARTSTAKAAPAKRSTGNADKMADSIMSGLDMLGSAPPTFQDMAQATADGQGGKISLRQLDALAGITQRIAPRGSNRLPRPGEEAGRMLEQAYIQQLREGRMHPDDFEEKVLQLNKAQLIDPYGLNQDYEGE